MPLLIYTLIILIIFCFIVSTRANTFRTERSAVMNAPASAIFEQVNDFHKWEAWSPWAKMDPKAKNTFEGSPSGLGAIFVWDGNKNVGAGRMTIIESIPGNRILIRIEFFRPFKGENTVEFAFHPEGEATRVTWSMYGKNSFMGKLISLFVDCDKMIGEKYSEGLASLKALVETK